MHIIIAVSQTHTSGAACHYYFIRINYVVRTPIKSRLLMRVHYLRAPYTDNGIANNGYRAQSLNEYIISTHNELLVIIYTYLLYLLPTISIERFIFSPTSKLR